MLGIMETNYGTRLVLVVAADSQLRAFGDSRRDVTGTADTYSRVHSSSELRFPHH